MVESELLSELLGIPNVRVSHYEKVGQQQLTVYIESTSPAGVCPECEQLSLNVHQIGEVQLLRDLPIWNRRCYLGYAPRRFKCKNCEHTFVEKVSWRESGLDYTVRYAASVYQRTRQEPLAQVAQAEGLSEAIVQGIFERGAKKPLLDGVTLR